jgi:hypothetical protein
LGQQLAASFAHDHAHEPGWTQPSYLLSNGGVDSIKMCLAGGVIDVPLRVCVCIKDMVCQPVICWVSPGVPEVAAFVYGNPKVLQL